jgi:hypothetical protein
MAQPESLLHSAAVEDQEAPSRIRLDPSEASERVEGGRTSVSFRIPLKPTRDRDRSDSASPALWLSITQFKESAPGYRHAWGTVHVSTREDGGDSYPIQSLRLRIDTPIPGSSTTDDQTHRNAANCYASCVHIGSVDGAFTSRWDAWVTEPGFGTWTIGDDW